MRLRAKIAIFIMVEKTGLWCYKNLHGVFHWLVSDNDWHDYMTIRSADEARKMINKEAVKEIENLLKTLRDFCYGWSAIYHKKEAERIIYNVNKTIRALEKGQAYLR